MYLMCNNFHSDAGFGVDKGDDAEVSISSAPAVPPALCPVDDAPQQSADSIARSRTGFDDFGMIEGGGP